MPKTVSISYSPLALPKGGTAVVFVGADGRPTPAVAALLGEETLSLIARAVTVERFKGKAGSVMTQELTPNVV